APGHERDADKTTTRANQAGNHADDCTRDKLSECARHLAAGRWLLVQEHLCRGKRYKHTEKDRQIGSLEQREHTDAAHQTTDNDAGRQFCNDIPTNGSTLVMRPYA